MLANINGRRDADRRDGMNKFCSAPQSATNIPLQVKDAHKEALLLDVEFKNIATEELIGLASERKGIYTVDRASAIAVLKGASGPAKLGL